MLTMTTVNAPLMILIINMFISQLGVGLVVPVLPNYMQEFGASGTELGYLLSAMGVTLFLFSPIAGELSDQYGRKKNIIFGVGLFCISQSIFGFANDLWVLYISRLIGGIGIAFMSAPINAYVADITTEENRGQSMGWLGAAMSLGFAIGPGIGGFLADYGLRVPFYTAAIVAAISTVATWLMLPETLSWEEQQAARMARNKRDNVLRQLVLSFRTPYVALLLLVFIMTFGLANVEAIFGLYVSVKYGFAPKDISVVITVGVLMGVLIQALLIGRVLQRFKEQQVISVCLFFTVATLLLMLLSGNFWYILTVTLFFFAFISALRPTINTLLSKMAGNEQGFVAGMNNAYTSLGIISGPAVAGILFDIHTDLPYIFGAFALLVSLLVSIFGAKNEYSARVALERCSDHYDRGY